MDKIAVRVPNWKKFNPREDVKKPTWFRLEYTVATSEALFDLTFEERWVFISLLAFIVERVTQGEVQCRADWFARHYGVSREAIDGAIEKLLQNGTVADVNADVTQPVRTRDADVTPTCEDVPLRDETRRDGTNNTDPPNSEKSAEKKTEPTECLWAHPDLKEFLDPVPIAGQKAWVTMVGTRFLIEPELHRARAWWVNNRERRKPGDTVARFVNGWLNGALEKLAKEKPEAARDAPTAAYAPTPGFGGGLKACEQDKADMRAAPADPKRVRDIVARVTGKM